MTQEEPTKLTPGQRMRRRRLRSDPLKIAINMEQKMGLPDFSSVSVSMHLSGITEGYTDEEITRMVERGKVSLEILGRRVSTRAIELKKKAGYP